MTNPSKRKGSSFELLIQRYVDEVVPCSRIPAGRSDDLGDLWVGAPVAIQCKNRAQLSLGAWLTETLEQTANANADFGFLVVKRRGSTAPADQFAITNVETMRRLIALIASKEQA
jgi:hypothetical protein